MAEKKLGNFLKKEHLFKKDGSSPRHFFIHFDTVDWIREERREYFSHKVREVMDSLYLYECWNTTVEVRGFNNGITLKSILQPDDRVIWPYELTARVVRHIMKRLNLPSISVYCDDDTDWGNNYYILDNMMNILDIVEIGEGGG